jgi:hypothetical protein
MLKDNKKYFGKTKCCKAEVKYVGGGYDGEDIVPITSYCRKCGKASPQIIKKLGRPKALPF